MHATLPGLSLSITQWNDPHRQKRASETPQTEVSIPLLVCYKNIDGQETQTTTTTNEQQMSKLNNQLAAFSLDSFLLIVGTSCLLITEAKCIQSCVMFVLIHRDDDVTNLRRSWQKWTFSLSLSGSLQLRYNLGGLLEPFAVDLDQRNLANGQSHSVNITRIEREIHVQVRSRIYGRPRTLAFAFARGRNRTDRMLSVSVACLVCVLHFKMVIKAGKVKKRSFLHVPLCSTRPTRSLFTTH